MRLRKLNRRKTLKQGLAGIAPIYKVAFGGEAKLIGTGFWITEMGHLITAWHVIEDNIGKDGVDDGPIYAMQALGGGAALPRVLRKSHRHNVFDLALSETSVSGEVKAHPTRPLPMTLDEPEIGDPLFTHAFLSRDQKLNDEKYKGISTSSFDGLLAIPDLGAQSIAALEQRKLEYVLGVRERSSAEVRSTVIDDQTPFVPLVVPRVSGELTELEAKQVKIGNRRYIVCRNLAEARRDAEQRSAILDGLRAKLAQGDKALVGNSGFRRYLKTVSAEHFAVDETRVAEDARFDGLYVLRTNTKLTPLQVMLRYRDLLRVEQLFRQAKAVLATRPIYHSSDMAIRGHVFCSFLALLLVKELEDRLHRHNIAAEWDDILRDLDRLQEIELEQDGKRFLLRTPTTGVAGKLFQAVGVALPPNLQELPLTTPQPAA